MQQIEATTMVDRAERKRLEAVVETLASAGSRGETVAEVAHDARNMVTALGLYCDLLEEPGVLANPFTHYGSELRLVAAASRRLVEKLVTIDTNRDTARNALTNPRKDSGSLGRRLPVAVRKNWVMDWDPKPSAPIGSLAVELLANHNLLAALAGTTITLTVDVDGGARPVWMTGEDLTRVLVNLVRNASEAMPSGGCIQVGLHELPASPGAARAIVEAAGGSILACNRPEGGARFEIELPVRKLNARQ